MENKCIAKVGQSPRAIRTLALAGASFGALSLSSAASAATATTPVITSVTAQSPTFCTVRFTSSITGTVDEVNGTDGYAVVFGTSAQNFSFQFPTVANGTTRTGPFASGFFANPNTSAGTVTLFIYDRDASSANPTALGQLLASAPIPVNMLQAAGGVCAQGVQNLLHTVDAGPDQTVAAGSTVNLAGTATDPEMDPLTTIWFSSSNAPALNNPNSLTPSFTAPARAANAQTLTYNLSVEDNRGRDVRDSVTITVPGNQGPTAITGAAQNVAGRANVDLDASASTDPERDALTFQWTQLSGAPVNLNGATTATPSFIAPVAVTAGPQTLEFQVTVTDSFGATSTAQQVVTVDQLTNIRPVADAGSDSTAAAGSTVTLDGSASSDDDGDPLLFQWRQVSGPAVTLSDDTSTQPTFTAPAGTVPAQQLVFELVVDDATFTSAPDQVTITIPANDRPIVDAGAIQTVSGGSSVTLNATASDPENDPLTYNWIQLAGPQVTLSSNSALSPSFTAPAATSSQQLLIFELSASDGLQSVTSIAEVIIAANNPPIADAGTDFGPIDSGQTVTLDGSASSDPDGDSLTYSWTQVSGTAVSLTGGTSASPTFVAPLVNGSEDLVFELVVNDGTASSPADRVTVNIRAVGSITIIQQVIGRDTTVAFSSNVAGLNGSITTSGGSGQISVAQVTAGTYSITAADLSAQGYALTGIVCNDNDSVAYVSSRSVALDLSPSEDLVCTFSMTNSRDAATAAIGNFLTGRNALIMAHQPDLQRRLDRLQSAPGNTGTVVAGGVPVPVAMPFSMSLSSGQANVSTSLATVAAAAGDTDRGRQAFDIWAEAYFSRATIGGQEADFRIFHVGADYRVSENLLLGVLGEFDQFDDRGELDVGEAEGDGWLVGPYILTKFAPNLFGEVRAAWGRSENRVSPFGTYVDDFDTSRSFYSGSLIGQFDLGNETTIRPEVTVRYLSEQAKSYTDSLNIVIPGQKVDQGDVSFRPRIHHLVEMDGGWAIRPFGEIEGIYTFGTDLNAVLDNGLRARVEGGVDLFSSGSFRASLSAFHDGIGAENYRSSGGHISVSFGF